MKAGAVLIINFAFEHLSRSCCEVNNQDSKRLSNTQLLITLDHSKIISLQRLNSLEKQEIFCINNLPERLQEVIF